MASRQKSSDQDNSPAFFFLAIAVFLAGLGHIALLPVFEGGDEVAHYSNIEQIAGTGTLPVFGQSFVSADAMRYREYGPLYKITDLYMRNGVLVYEKADHIGYPDFFASSKLKDNYMLTYRGASPLPHKPAKDGPLNWEAQHPPLYYLLLAGVMKITNLLPFVTQFFMLRLVSFSLAFCGLLIGLAATLKYLTSDSLPDKFIVAGFMLYPFIFPVFFQAFGRLNNDALCLLIVALIWSSTLSCLEDGFTPKKLVGIGFWFGMGLLTKAIFIPLLAGYCLFLAARLWQNRDEEPVTFTALLPYVSIPGLALIIGGAWYTMYYFAFGTMLGNFISITLLEKGGLIAGLSKNFSFIQWMQTVNNTFMSISWFRTSSGTNMPQLQLPLTVLFIWMLAAYVRAVWKKSFIDTSWSPAWLLVPLFASIMYYILQVVAVDEAAITIGGWYAHILSPMLGLSVAYGLSYVWNRRPEKILISVLIFYAVCFFFIATWCDANVFTGCATVEKGLFAFADTNYCFGHLDQMPGRLAILSWPVTAALAFVGSIITLLLGALTLRAKY